MKASTRSHYEHELSDLEHELLALGRMADEAIQRAAWALGQHAYGEAEAIIRDDDHIDAATRGLEENLLRLQALQQPMVGDLRLVNAFLRCTNDLERIGDYAEGIASILLRSSELSQPLPVPDDIQTMAQQARSMLAYALDALAKRDPTANLRLKDQDDVIDDLYASFSQNTLVQMQNDPEMVKPGTYLLWIAHNFERIADQTTNIGENVEFIVRGKVSKRRDQPKAQ